MILKNYYKNAVPVGVYPMCHFGGLAVLAIEGETAIAAFNWGKGSKQIRRRTIFYTRKGGSRYYLDQIQRIGGGTA